MQTAPLKSFATWARTALIREVTGRIAVVLAPASPQRIEQPKAVAALEAAITAAGGGEKGRDAVTDWVAYTWFNRIIALRFMDANGYTGIGVVSPQAGVGVGQPEILAEAKRANIDPQVVSQQIRESVSGLLNGTRRSDDPQGEAYALLLVEYCRHWNRAMPFMFERQGDFTELLMPANLLADDSVLNRAVAVLTTDACQDVEVIGWLYQFYISERKDEVFASFKKNKKAGAAEITAATQLFTPDWIVRYLVENSVGRLWMLNHPTSRLVDRMSFYIAPIGTETEFLRVESPEELSIIDPACGSGHMLTYAFDLLYEIYLEAGFAPAEIPSLIIKNNLFGTEIDSRAGALAAFALAMKCRARQRTFFNNELLPNVSVLKAISFTSEELDFLSTATGDRDRERDFWNQFEHADVFGSLVQPDPELTVQLAQHLETFDGTGDLLSDQIIDRAEMVLEQARYLLPRYSVVVANPPYMGASRMSSELKAWLKSEIPVGRAGLDVAFWARAMGLLVPSGRAGLVTMQSWMFLATYAEFRAAILDRWSITGAIHLGPGAFPEISGEVVGTVALLMTNHSDRKRVAPYVKLTESTAKESDVRDVAAGGSLSLRFDVSLDELATIPRIPIAYWMGEAERKAFRRGRPISTVCKSGNGLTTSDNDRFLRMWWELSRSHIEFERAPGAKSSRRWHPINKGGGFRRWAGNRDFVIDWDQDGRALYDLRPESTVRNPDLYFRPSVSWSDIVTGPVSFRYYPQGWIFDASANSLFPDAGDDIEGLLAFANSSFATKMAPLLNPGLHFKLGDMGSLPYLKRSDTGWRDEISELIAICERDWDSVETGVGYLIPSLLRGVSLGSPGEHELSKLGALAAAEELALTARVYELESKNNAQIANQFELDAGYSEPWPISDVALIQNPWSSGSKSDQQAESDQMQRMVEDLVSYGVGCMFGRYSLDAPGLILADRSPSLQPYLNQIPTPKFMPDSDNVIPIVDGDWFEDDIVTRFRQFLRVAFGERHFEENLRFVTEALGVKDLRDYFVKSFYKDHVQRYKKRPIYWLFSSPKGSFNALIYMHRYTPSTVSTVLNEYLREFKAKLEATLGQQERLAAGGGTPRQQAAAQKEADRIRKMLLELDEYEHDVLYPLASRQIEIDLDDGVKLNYPKFGAALKKIPGLEAGE